MEETTQGSLMVLGAAAGFGTIGIFGELAVAAGLELATLLLFRFMVATVLVLIVATIRSWSLPWSKRDWTVSLGLGVVYAAMTLSFFIALRSLTAGLATIVLYTYPGFVVVLSMVFLHENINIRKGIALGLSMTGIVLIVGTDTTGIDPVGVGFALGAAACYAVYTTGSRAVVREISRNTLIVGVFAGAAGSMVVYSALSGQFLIPTGRREWGIVAGLAVVGTVVPLALFYKGVARLEASRVGIVSTAEPAVTVVLGALLLGESITLTIIGGGALVLSGVLLIQRGPETNGERSEASSTRQESYQQ
jgi:drug/metabolite transporter (DMT)-like permease